MELTYSEKLFLHNLNKFISMYKYTPTIRELCKYTNLNSTATVYYYLKKLEGKGYIKRLNNRSIEIIRSDIV